MLVAAATKRDKVLRPILQKLAGQSLRAIAAELDRRGIQSWSGRPWNGLGQECDGTPRLPDNRGRVMTIVRVAELLWAASVAGALGSTS
jgi:hypothetical protein